MPVHTLKNFKQWSHLGLDQKLVFRRELDIPFVVDSIGVPSYEVNAYVHYLIQKNLKQGTIRNYAHDVIHLLHFIEKQPLLTKFRQLTDSTFTLFVQSLQAERTALGELKRKNNTVIKIAHSCIDFLRFIQNLHDLKNFIGSANENSIKIIPIQYKKRTKRGRAFIEQTTFTHTSIPRKDEVNRRYPVAQEDALRIWEFIKTQDNKDKRLRDMALYTVMEQVGGRVKELHLIKMSDYEEARSTGMLTLSTLKRKGNNSSRKIPVPHVLLSVIADYIKVRKRVMRAKSAKHDFLFVSLTTGQGLSADSWTTYINIWKKKLGIQGSVHPHLWRHAFITDKLKQLILTTKEVNDKDDFRKYLLHTEKFKMQLQQWTGHSAPNSLDTYIDLVFADLNGYTEIYDAVALKSKVTIAQRQLKAVKERMMENKIKPREAVEHIESILNAFDLDITASGTTT